MGNTSSDTIGEEYKKKFDSEIQYELFRKKEISDVFNCEVTIYRERQTDRYVASFDKGYSNHQFDEKMLDYLQNRIKDNDRQLIKIIGYFSDTSAESICGNSYQQCYFVDYPIGTLRNEIDLRKYMNKSFKETELWSFLITIVEGLRIIKKMGKTCRNISSSTIFIDDEGGYRISEQGLVKGISLFEETVLKIYAKDIYLSPEQVRILKAQDPLPIDNTDPFMSDIFSLGALLVEMMYLENQGDLFRYNPDEGLVTVKVRELKERLPFNGSYSQTLQRLVCQMIEKKVKNRINLEELSEQLQISFDRYLSNEFGEEGGKAMKMELTGKTPFLEYILKRNDYEKEYRWGNYGQDDSTEQQLRRAQANKLKNYQSKPNIEDLDDEEDVQNQIQGNKMQLSKFLALQNEKHKEANNEQLHNEHIENDHQKIVEEKEFDGQNVQNTQHIQEVIYENEDSEFQIDNSLMRPSHKKYQQINQEIVESEIKLRQSDGDKQQQFQHQQVLQQSQNQQYLQHSQSQFIQSSQSQISQPQIPQQHLNHNPSQSLQFQQTPTIKQDSKIQESSNKYSRILNQNVPLKFMQPFFKSSKNDHSPQRNQKETGQFPSPSNKDSVIRSSSQLDSHQQKQQQQEQQQQQLFKITPQTRSGSSSMYQQPPQSTNQILSSRNNKQCNIDHFDMRINKDNIVSDKFSEICKSFKQLNNPNPKLLKLSNQNNVHFSNKIKISSAEGIATPAATSFRSNIIKKKSISQILLANAKKQQQNTLDRNINAASPLRVQVAANLARAFSPVIASRNSNNGKFFQNTFSQGLSLTANKKRFLADKLSISPI